MTGTKNGEPNYDGKQTRYKYSPTHQDAAVCCVPNAGRIAPYFVQSMWFKDPEGLVASLAGPCELQTEVNGTKVKITEETGYPFENTIRFHLSVDWPIAFVLKIRKPGWVKQFEINSDYNEIDGYIVITRTWVGNEHLKLDFFPEIEVNQDQNHESYFRYGALVFAAPLKSREIVSKQYPLKGFRDLQYEPISLVRYKYSPDYKPELFREAITSAEKPWNMLTIKTTLINKMTGTPEKVDLKPIAGTILRQETFKDMDLNVASGTIVRVENFPSKFVDPRNVDIWLPDGYTGAEKYAVLYMHDGQMLYDSLTTWNRQEWGVDEVMGELIAEKKIRKCIVVGVWNNGSHRHIEYFPEKALSYLTAEERADLLNQTRGADSIPLLSGKPLSNNYLKFLIEELKPFIDSSFSTIKDKKSTIIAGSSMGGLISMYAICEYPGIFGGAACLSTHWPGTFEEKDNPVPGAFLAYLRDHLPSPKDHKIYFDYGTATLDAMYKPYQQQADVIMKAGGYSSKNWITREFPGEDHSERAWNKRLSIPVIFMLGGE